MAFVPFYPGLLRILARTLQLVSTAIFCERAKPVASLWMGVELSFLCISSCVALQIDSRFVWEKECSFGFVTSLLL